MPLVRVSLYLTVIALAACTATEGGDVDGGTSPTDSPDASVAGGDDGGAVDAGGAGEPDAGMDGLAPLTWQYDSSADSSRTIYGDRTGHVVFSVNFTTTESNEKRRVRADLVINQDARAGADPLMMAAASISCRRFGGGNDYKASLGNTQNVIKGTTLELHPQFIFETGPVGSYRCQVAVQGGRPRPTGSFDNTRYVVDSGSRLGVSSPVHPGADSSHAPTTVSLVLDDGEAFDAAPLTWTAPAGVREFYAFGAVKLTACTSVGGSDDPYDDLGDLCGLPAHEIDTRGTNAIVSFKVMQFANDGGYCTTTSVPASSGSVHVSKDTHHEMVYRQATSVSVSNAPECTREFRIKMYVKQTSGASMVLHKQGTITGAVPL